MDARARFGVYLSRTTPSGRENAWSTRISWSRPFACVLVLFIFACALTAAESKGEVKFGGLPVPGATVTATQGDRSLVAVTDQQGNYSFADLPDGVWNFQVEMLGFAPIKQEVTIAAGAGAPEWDLKMLPLDEMKALAAPAPPPRISLTQPQETPQTTAAASPNTTQKSSKNKKAAANAQQTAAANQQNSFQRTAVNANPNAAPAADTSSAADAAPANSPFGNQSASDLNQRASDGLLINGTVNNGASSPFAQAAAFGNNRRGPGSLYNGSLALIEDNSALDAKTFSFTGQDTPKPEYDHIQGLANFGGPLRIPHLIRNGPQIFVNYQWLRNHTVQTIPYTMPTAAQRDGDFSAAAPIYDPTNGAPFPNNQIPVNRISPQALALLNFYPMPNLAGPSVYNYQIPIVGETHQDQLRLQMNKNVGNRNSLYGYFAFQSNATDNPNEFGFLDRNNSLGVNTQANWQHRFNQRMFVHFQVQFSRYSTQAIPWFDDNREYGNVSSNAGIQGNNQEPVNWGPPSLTFGSGIAPLSDAIAASNHNQTTAFTYDSLWVHGRHEFTWVADYKRVQFNSLSQSNPRGAFTFTGAYTEPPAGSGTQVLGSDFADFLLGVPDASSIAFGNADKYFRESLYDAAVNDNWRIGPSLTVNYGLRWDYGSPITELYGRLVNLDVAPGFTAVAPVTGANSSYFVNPSFTAGSVGPLTGVKYPDSLLQPDKHGFEPQVGIAWRPIPASSLVIRAGYSLRYNTSVYQTIATLMSQQSPLSTSLSVQNTPANPLTLANGFTAPVGTVTNTFAVDPNFRIGYAQNWTISAQRDLPGSLVITATYLGIKGTRGPQEFLPNTYPEGSTVNQCPPTCPALPSGFIYMTSNGNSTREAGSLQLRRRLHNGFLASATYTYSKSIDDSALGGRNQGTNVIAQNWLDLSAERGLSSFDQRHNLAFQMQYTTGQGIAGGTLLSGWRGALFKEWTAGTTINAGTGLPLTPTVEAAQAGTGVLATIRPDYTGAALYAAPAGYGFNPEAYTLAPLGQWGNAGRDTITGPIQFTLNASLGRTFRLHDRYSLNLRVDATNALNHVTFTGWNTIINSPQFGLPAQPANAMRDLITTLRLNF